MKQRLGKFHVECFVSTNSTGISPLGKVCEMLPISDKAAILKDMGGNGECSLCPDIRKHFCKVKDVNRKENMTKTVTRKHRS